ncbi:MAG: SUMF1/EgtB/PvdO family nonheme iron enzyme [Treponema sp.]|nr:SUMF1/EgtB/PvdO family nonheme iron enzyme [Treponema sp.]
MTRSELEKNVNIGDIVKITTKHGEFTGRVEEFVETAVKLTNLKNRRAKRIAYDFILTTNIVCLTNMVSIGVDTNSKMVAIPGTNYRMGQTQVTQRLYKKVMGENPSYFQLSNDNLDNDQRKVLEEKGNTDNNPVECVSWYDAIYFCNKLSMMEGLTPAYSVDEETDPEYWNYTPHQGESILISRNNTANGYRLPWNNEWENAAKGGEDYTYSGSDNLEEVGWYKGNSNHITHPVAQKIANGYGLYDMSGNVWEWVWNTHPNLPSNYIRGGGWDHDARYCEVDFLRYNFIAYHNHFYIGFRLLRPID